MNVIRQRWYPVTGFPSQRRTTGPSQRRVGSFSAQPWGPSIWISRCARTNAMRKKYAPIARVIYAAPFYRGGATVDLVPQDSTNGRYGWERLFNSPYARISNSANRLTVASPLALPG